VEEQIDERQVMGANSTQAQAIALFFVAMICVAGSLAADLNWLLMILGLAILAVSAVLFRKCKPWEIKEE
jgi:hypothetical protein